MCVDVLKLARDLPLAQERYWHGDLTLAARPCAAVLNSSQGRHPHGGEPWVRETVRATAGLIDDEKVLLSSLGLVTWELAVWAASEALGDVVLLVPLPEGTIPEDAPLQLQRVFDDFGLSKQNALAIPFFVPPRASAKTLWKARDAVILRNADKLVPVSIREGGFLASCLRDPRIEHKIEGGHRVAYSPARAPLPRIPEAERVHAALVDLAWDYAVHWTRMADGPWPGESRIDWFTDMVQARDSGYRSAEATLRRMLEENRVRATGWRMPMNRELVSFSALPPWEIVSRMRWRKRYLRVNYEPWGIGVKREVLERLGGREVIYGDLETRKALSAADRLFFQRISDKADWENEREWRLRGDLKLSELAGDEAVVFVPDTAMAGRIRPLTRFRVISLT